MLRGQLQGTSARLPRAAVIVLACLLLGFAAGALISSAAAARRAPRISDAEYALMVADLYEHEKSVLSARERLAALGRDPIDLTEAAFETVQRERPEARREIESLRQLAQALRQAEAEVGGRSGAAGPGIVGLLALIVASVLLAGAAAWGWKQLETRGMRLPRIPSAGATASTGGARLRLGRGAFATALATVAGSPPRHVDDDEDEEETRPVRSTPRSGRAVSTPRPLANGARISRAPAARPRTLAVFDASYEPGDDPYDEIHPILDDRGEMVGACGLSATEPSGRPGRYYGFTAWLQEYRAGNELAAIGLVASAGQAARSAAIAEWRRRGTIDEVEVVEPGLEIPLRTTGIAVRLTIADCEYATPTGGSPGYFGRLAVRFEVDSTGR